MATKPLAKMHCSTSLAALAISALLQMPASAATGARPPHLAQTEPVPAAGTLVQTQGQVQPPIGGGTTPANPDQHSGNAGDDASSPATAESAGSDKTTDIVVTGSRLARAGYDAPTPVNVIGEERLQQLGINNIGEALNQIPSFRATNSPANNSFRVSGNIAGRILDLRGLGATRTLVLLDGRRVVGSSDQSTVDLNAIPSILIQRSEVVTGGASAAYGANAVAGVVNLIIDSKLSGVKAEASNGISERGDSRQTYVAVAAGTRFGGDRGHIVFGAEYQEETGIGPCETRSWCSKYTNYVANPGYNTATRTSTNGLPATLVLDNVMFVYNENGILTGATKPGATPGSTITLGQQVLNVGATSLPAALRNRQFDAAGNLAPYTFGNLLSGTFAQYPNGDPTQPYLLGFSPSPLVVPVRHLSAMTRASYDLTDTISVSAELLYSRVVGGPTRAASPVDSTSIGLDNPYLSAETVAAVRAADPGITRLLLNHGAVAFGATSEGRSVNSTYRAALSVKGEFGRGWAWDAYYTYGRVDSDVVVKNVRLKTWNASIDAVRVTAANRGTSGLAIGSIACRSTLTNPGNGCIPQNLFGAQGFTPEQRAAYAATATQDRNYQQHVAAANLRGSPFSTWAGEVNVAFGGEYRRDTAVGGADANSLAGNYIATLTSALPFTKTTVAEGYLEAGVPLLKDSALGEALDVDGAVRWTHYNTFGNATTWKLGGVYTPVRDITLRVTRSRDIRAPTPAESSPNATTLLTPLTDPFIGSTTQQYVITGGNPNLRLEHANTFTAGVVLKPSFVPRFNMSVDYYNIKVDGAIDSLTAPAISTACRNQALLCDLITFNPNGSINTVFSNFQNLSQLRAKGLEFIMDYRLPFGSANIDFQGNANYIIDLSTTGATGLVTQLDDVTGNAGSIANVQGVPRYKLDGVLTYSNRAFSVSAHGRYIPEGILDATKIGPEDDGYNVNDPASITTNRIDDRFYLDLTARIKVPGASGAERWEVYGTINNVFDTGEPKQLRLTGNSLNFDPIGRYFKVGIRSRW